MNAPRFAAILVFALVLGSLTGTARGQTDEEQYVQEITSLIVEADFYLAEESDALAACLANFTGCVADPSPIVLRLNGSRNGLIGVRADVLALGVPVRYVAVNDLTVAGLTDSIAGIALHMEGLQEGSLTKFETGSDFMAQGRDELREAVAALRTMPPRSLLADILLVLAIGLAGSLAFSVIIFLRWYRRNLAVPPPAPKRKGEA